MSNEIYRNTYLKIDLNAIKYNLETIQLNLGKNQKIIPVLKANAYGHGSIEIARYLEKENYDFFAVALLEEAIDLRKAGVKANLLVLGWVSPHYANLAIEYNLILTAFQKEWLLDIYKLDLQGKLNIHIKIDTGMGRNGLLSEWEVRDFIKTIMQIPLIHVQGIYTHFATADQKDTTYYQEQIKKWHNILDVINEFYSSEALIIHIGNSGASIQHPKDMTTYSRVGVSIYGMYPSQNLKHQNILSLKPALELKSEIVHVKQVLPDTKIGYGGTYTAKENEWIGTVAIGYADGWLRKLQNTEVLVKGKRLQIIGRICMDMLMIKLDQAYDLGTEVTLIGHDGNDFISVDDVAQTLETINYEITTNLTARIPRIYK